MSSPLAMFAKPKLDFAAFLAPDSPVGKAGQGLAKLFRNPFAAPAAAAGTLAIALSLFLTISSDPKAAAPSVRVSLLKTSSAPAHGHSASPHVSGPVDGAEAFTLDSLGLFQDTTAPGFEHLDGAPVQGTASITLPEGETGLSAGTKTVRNPLQAAPIAGVVQPGPLGPMPIIAPDGRSPFSAYARPFRDDGRPKIALVVGGLGINPTATKMAIERLPSEVTLSFVPYTEGLQGWIDLARANGHEVMIEIPMEPVNYPDNDPGPYTLISGAPGQDMNRKMDWLLSRATGYFAVSNYLGGRFLSSANDTQAFMDVLKSKGLGFVDDGQVRGKRGAWARASADRVIDTQLTRESIQAQLEGLEYTAKNRGAAFGTGFAYPVTVDVAVKWAASLETKGLQLAPVSAVSKR